jgi:hypothetical protein
MDIAELRPVTADDLEKVAAHLQAGKNVAPITVRHLLLMFGNSRRGYWVVKRIRDKLKQLGLQTDPDFEQAYIYGSIRFKLAEGAPSIPQWPETGAPQQTTEVEAVVVGVVDPTLRLSRLAAANKALISVKPRASSNSSARLRLQRNAFTRPRTAAIRRCSSSEGRGSVRAVNWSLVMAAWLTQLLHMPKKRPRPNSRCSHRAT